MQSFCNHNHLLAWILADLLQKCLFHRKIYSNSDSGKSSVGRAKTLSECLVAHFSYEVYTTKKVSENSETFILGAENETRTRDPNLGKVVLYQLSYFRKNCERSKRFYPFCECKYKAKKYTVQENLKKTSISIKKSTI